MRAGSALLSIAVALSAGCGAGQRHGLDALQHPARENCLVLSAGGPAGVAHLGAIEALREAHVPITCVVGTSMGAVVGALYASSPRADTTARFEHFAASYVRTTRAEAEDSGGLGGLIGALIGAATGGVGAVLLGAAGGALMGSSSVRPVDHQRFVRVLDTELGGARIEDLPMAFATMHQVRSENSANVVVQQSGSLATAVGASAANPFIFGDLDPRSMQRMDPGMDRRSAVPVDLACDAHPHARLIVINVTNEPARLLAGQTCELIEVRVGMPGGVALPAAMQPGPTFRQVVDAGRVATRVALDGYATP